MNLNTIRFVFIFVVAAFALILSSSTSTAQEAELPPLKVVQLGDSYSAGNGGRSATGDRNYSGVSSCYRSPTNWGSQFVGSLQDVFNVTYIHRACSGGIIANILNERQMGLVPATEFRTCPSPAYPDEEVITRLGATEWCVRSLRPQIDAIDSSVDLVIMTMGGNDVQFATIVERCFVIGRRDPTVCREAVENAHEDLVDVEEDLIKAFTAIRDKLKPEARIAFVTYPYLVPDVDYQIGDNRSGDTYAAAQEIRALGLEGDRRQRAAVEAANTAAGEEYIVFFDGTKELFKGHLPNPLADNPDRWLFGILDTRIHMEWYHFNPLGHQNLGSALSPFESFGAPGGSFDTGADIDVVFVVDTTGSMEDEIAQVRADLSDIVAQLAAATDSYRVAVVSYRDFPARTGDSIDYPSRVDQTFTEDLASIQDAIDALTAEGGGDDPETVFSGIQAALELPWRPGVTKIALVIGDAPALSPEPLSNLTAAQIVANSIAIDPVQVIGVDVANLNSNGALGEIAAGTGGSIVPGASELTTVISEILDRAAQQPLAWIGVAYSGKIGQPILFDASGSYDPSGRPLTLYEWDFDGDGVFDLETEEGTVTHVYNTAFNDFVVVRVTGAGGTALASARTVVNAEGFVSQGDEEPCELDENGFSIIVDEEGRFIPCTADSLPEADKDGVVIQAPTALDNHQFLPMMYGLSLDLQYKDDFSDPASGWPIFEDTLGTFSYVDDEYEIFHTSDLTRIAVHTEHTFTDYSYQVDTRLLPSEAARGYGLIFGFKDNNNYLVFLVDSSQNFGVQRLTDNQWIILHEWKEIPVPYNPPPATNRLRVDHTGETYVVYINDQEVARGTDAQLTGVAQVGLTFTNWTAGISAAVRFDNVEVHALPE
jgi:PKD repeat protein/lysophospholipase L1-like esterase